MMHMEHPAQLFSQFPKTRSALPAEYLALREGEYLSNRTSGGLANRVARKLENWMHAKASQCAVTQPEEILELGAGPLNHLGWEKHYAAYDIVEPFRKLCETSPNLQLIRNVYNGLGDIPDDRRYDRIISVAVLEHLLDLPFDVALAGLHLHDHGVFCAGIPSEGSLLWETAWRYGTGAAFRWRTGLDYARLMRYEHVNTALEIDACIRYFFRDVALDRYPLPPFSLSLYTFLRAQRVDRERCAAFVKSRRQTQAGEQVPIK